MRIRRVNLPEGTKKAFGRYKGVRVKLVPLNKKSK